MASSLSISKILKAVTEARAASPAPHLCVVGAGEDLARVVAILSAGAKDEAGGVSALVDALTPADFPRDQRLAGRWDIVVLVAAGAPAADMVPVVHAARRAGCKTIGLVDAPDAEAWEREVGMFSD